MILAYCTCEEAPTGTFGPCSFCLAGVPESDDCVKCPHCYRLQIPRPADGPCRVCEQPMTTPSTPADRCPRCADTGLIRQGFGRQPKPCGCWVGTPSTPKEAT